MIRTSATLVLAAAVFATSPTIAAPDQFGQRVEADCIAQYEGAHPNKATRSVQGRQAFVSQCVDKAVDHGQSQVEKACINEYRADRREHKTTLDQESFVQSCMKR